MKRTLLLAFLSIAAVAAIISNPDEAFQASLQGLTVWWNIVFPGLLPFLVLLELMHAFGAVHALGSLIDPLMRRIFGLPGASGLAIAAGWTGGYTAGAESVAALRRSETVTKREGQRLLALAHMPSPLFMLLVIGAGFLHRAELGAAIVAAVWMTALLAALAQRLFAKQEKLHSTPLIAQKNPQPLSVLLRHAAAAMNAERQRDGRTFGKALGDSVINGVYKLMAVGGFMMFAAVLVKLIEPLLPHNVPSWMLSGLLESHIGAYGAAVAPMAFGLPWNAAAIAAIVSWGGISALLQTGSAIAGTDLSLRQLAVNRLLQAMLAFVVTLLLWQPLTHLFTRLLATAAPALQQHGENAFIDHYAMIRASDLPGLWTYSPVQLLMFVCSIFLLVTFSLGAARLRSRQ
ncbi:Sporulation integral membrane protein YlbJ [Paenibacillus plantiphilus]|uniref:Sporulation integral membrane protein YlbJ n=1 Tax=Paenibacillus plantiphilus TaxID=2905650 RepID=A0ABM9C0R8_9BACL|nr:nucleoside recognition domain-containing protein [Paenibacillus plantiphilus]CAH1197897.1 Sporulation integral membrane protein YlbJ [Paenibacillus plantiphilus]